MPVLIAVLVVVVVVALAIRHTNRSAARPSRPQPSPPALEQRIHAAEPRSEASSPEIAVAASASVHVPSPSVQIVSHPQRREASPGSRPAELGQTPFAVIDVETTGFNPVPNGRHRIVEIAIVRISPEGRVEDEYVTLLNPEGRVGATHVHGIRDSDVIGAPVFAQVIGDIATRIGDAIVVAHNLPFDLRFLHGEFRNAGVVLPELPRLCTLDLAYRFADLPCRKLGFLCEEYGIPIDAHSALGDARATGQLLVRFLEHARREGHSPTTLGFKGGVLAGTGWFDEAPSGLSVTRPARAEEVPGPAARLATKRSRRRSTKLPEEQYSEALELALVDRMITAEEIAALGALAQELVLDVGDTHRRFMKTMVEGAMADGTVTTEERAELDRIAPQLGISTPELETMLAETPPPRPRGIAPGTSVCFVGSFDEALFTRMLTASSRAGAVFRKNITATVNLVVVASALSQPTRQDRARALGIPVMTSSEFLALTEVSPALA